MKNILLSFSPIFLPSFFCFELRLKFLSPPFRHIVNATTMASLVCARSLLVPSYLPTIMNVLLILHPAAAAIAAGKISPHINADTQTHTRNVCMVFRFKWTQLDLILKSEDGGDISDFITNGEWFLIGKYCVLTAKFDITQSLSLPPSVPPTTPYKTSSFATFGSITLNLSNPLNSRASF